MSIKQRGVLIAGGGQGGGQAVVNMDNITITNNANHEIQTVAKINQNNAVGSTSYLYDWCGTLEEYTAQSIATSHPEWICYITNDDAGSGGSSSVVWVDYGVTQFTEIKDLFDDNKLVCCKYNGKIYQCIYYITGTPQYFYFTCADTYNHVSYLRVSSEEAWINGGQYNQASITGAATTITSSDLNANRTIVSDSNGKIAASSITTTELGYLSGVSSAIQTQINNKVSKGYEIIAFQEGTVSNNYTWYKKLANGWVEQGCYNAAPGTFTLPIEMNSSVYSVSVTPLGTNDNASVHANIISSTQVEIDNENNWNMSLEVKGIAA